MRRDTPMESIERSRPIRRGWPGVVGIASTLLLTGCLDVLDGAVYRSRGDVVAIDITADRAMDARDERGLDAGDASRMDIAHAETTPPPDSTDTLPPDDVVDEENTPDTVDAIDATTDVMEIEASFTDGGLIDVIVPTDVLPDIPCPVCRTGQTCCAGQCVDIGRNEQNCGGCGVICPAPGVCQSGSCGRCLISLCGAEQRCCVIGLCTGLLCPQ